VVLPVVYQSYTFSGKAVGGDPIHSMLSPPLVGSSLVIAIFSLTNTVIDVVLCRTNANASLSLQGLNLLSSGQSATGEFVKMYGWNQIFSPGDSGGSSHMYNQFQIRLSGTTTYILAGYNLDNKNQSVVIAGGSTSAITTTTPNGPVPAMSSNEGILMGLSGWQGVATMPTQYTVPFSNYTGSTRFHEEPGTSGGSAGTNVRVAMRATTGLVSPVGVTRTFDPGQLSASSETITVGAVLYVDTPAFSRSTLVSAKTGAVTALGSRLPEKRPSLRSAARPAR